MVERETHTVANEVGFDMTDHGPDDTASNQHTAGADDDVNVQMCVGEQSRAAFDLRAA